MCKFAIICFILQGNSTSAEQQVTNLESSHHLVTAFQIIFERMDMGHNVRI
jgi:hypothetical protein